MSGLTPLISQLDRNACFLPGRLQKANQTKEEDREQISELWIEIKKYWDERKSGIIQVVRW